MATSPKSENSSDAHNFGSTPDVQVSRAGFGSGGSDPGSRKVGQAGGGKLNPGGEQSEAWQKTADAMRAQHRQTGPAYAELHAISNFSFLRGASHPEEMVRTAYALGYQAIAITDECSVAGVVKAYTAAKDLDIRLIVGAEFFLREGVHLVVLAPSRRAYGQLSELITRARRRCPKGQYDLGLDDLRWGLDDCLMLWLPGDESIERLAEQGERLNSILHAPMGVAQRLWIALELFFESNDIEKTANALTLSIRLDLPVVAAGGPRMHVVDRKPLQDVLSAIREKSTVAELGVGLDQNRERHLKPLELLPTLYPEEMLAESVAIAERCRFELDELRYEYPEELVPPGLTPSQYLRQLTEAGAKRRWPGGMPDDVRDLVEKELRLIADLAYEYFFLTVHDIVQFARSRGILCQGRGSAANSAVCYCLYITEVNPAELHLLFERFVSKERNEPPDIDVDFEHERREEVIQYIYKQYGRDRAALAATLITYRPRSAIRDVGKALGLDADLIDLLAKSMAWWDNREELHKRFLAAGIDPESRTSQQFIYLVNEILGFPRHLSQHVGGFVISAGPLAQLVPIENAAMEDRTVIQWDKDDLESLGLLKVDVLALGMLTAIRKAIECLGDFRLAHPIDGSTVTSIHDIPRDDPATYEMLQRADSVGVFQVESRAQMTMLPRLKPASFYDLVIEVAIVRPGPIQGNMVHPYLRRRQGLEAVTYSDDKVRDVLSRTLGIPIFQEQVIELAMVAAGFTAGEADQLRRAMAAWKRKGGLEHFESKLISGMLENGHNREFAERVFKQIQGFGEYGFPESHAASFALLVYLSAWLKRHEPTAFYCGLLNSLPMGFYTPSQLLQDAMAHDVEVQPVDVQHSGWDFRLEPARGNVVAAVSRGGRSDAGAVADTPVVDGRHLDRRPDSPGRRATSNWMANGRSADELLAWQRQTDPRMIENPQPALRVGLRQIKGLQEETARRIEAAQPFTDIDDLAARAHLADQDLTYLARAGALESLTGHRFQAHWDAAGVDHPAPLWAVAEATATYQTDVQLAAPSRGEDMLSDYRYLGLTLGPHPMSLLRNDTDFRSCRSAAELANYRQDQFIQVAGIVTCRQRPGTASGVIFMTLEDETGNSNIVIWNSILERFRAELLQSQLLAIKGVVEREGSVIHVVAGHVRDLSYKLVQLAEQGDAGEPFRSRNFH